MSKPYVIVSPPWETTSGGVRVMYGLYGHLLAKGQVAYMNERPATGDFIVVYPEIQQGNPTNAKTVVRYILNKPGVVPALYTDGTVKSGPTRFDPTDRLYYFSQLFSEEPVNPNRLLFLPILDLHTFTVQKGVQRKNKCKFIGKGIDTHSAYTEGLFSIDRSFAQYQQALADYLNTCNVMYCYDPCSAMLEVARLCGVRVVMMNNTQYTKDQFKAYEPGMNGISWGTEEEKELNVEQFRQGYIHLRRMFDLSLDQFIKDTQV